MHTVHQPQDKTTYPPLPPPSLSPYFFRVHRRFAEAEGLPPDPRSL